MGRIATEVFVLPNANSNGDNPFLVAAVARKERYRITSIQFRVYLNAALRPVVAVVPRVQLTLGNQLVPMIICAPMIPATAEWYERWIDVHFRIGATPGLISATGAADRHVIADLPPGLWVEGSLKLEVGFSNPVVDDFFDSAFVFAEQFVRSGE